MNKDNKNTYGNNTDKKLHISDVMNSVYVVSHKNWEGEQIIKICQSRIDAEYYITNEYNGIHEIDELSISKWSVIHYS